MSLDKRYKAFLHKKILLILLGLGFSPFTLAAVSSYEVTSRQAYAAGMQFGEVGAYEQIIGRIYYEIDPNNARNQVIADLALAPLNERGMIEMSGDFEILVPVDPEKGNGVVLLDVPNRGRDRLLNFNQGSAEQPEGDGFLMQQGFTLVWVGWEFDLDSGIRLQVPVTTDEARMPIAGLGFAAVRDIGSWIKYFDDALVSSDTLIAFGLSQSGRVLRSFLYFGFNTDEAERQVYDGLIPHIAGASIMDMNKRGADPLDQGQFNSTIYPFSDEAYTDPISSEREGLLENPRADHNQPRIFYTNSSTEYWGGARAAALVHSSPDGKQDISLADNVRFYLLAGTQHVPAPLSLDNNGNGQFPRNPLNYWWHMRALLTAMKDWIVQDVEPPASAHPNFADDTLVELAEVNFPAIPNVQSTEHLHGGVRIPNFLLESLGGAGAELPYLLPRVNEDGNEISGVLNPELVVPLATYTGWNFTNPDKGDQNILVTNTGSYIPFARNRELREAANDPRLSIAERYADKQDFLNQVSKAVEESINAGYILAADKAGVIEQAGRHWDLLMTP